MFASRQDDDGHGDDDDDDDDNDDDTDVDEVGVADEAYDDDAAGDVTTM